MTSAILDSESDEEKEEEEPFQQLSPRNMSAHSRRTEKTLRWTTMGGSMMSRANTARQNLRRPGSSIELPGAKITAYAMGLCTRMRLMDGINWDQIKVSLDPRRNRD